MTSRINQQTENTFITQISELDDGIRELKTGVQFTEAKLYEYSSGNAYDLSGSLGSSAGSNQVLALLLVTATSVDAASFLSAFTPELWIPNTSTPYHDTLVTDYQISYNKIITDDITKTQYWYQISARNAVSASTFYLKAHIYATVPVTVAYARLI
ncbi:hypothetical protein AB4Y95_00115 [Arthrobacter sp. M-10]|uniref:hypothetical protein n=1 Tax=Arthrobacter sp. M-10 TaxID=3233037 RepID=UPI003F8F99A2